MDWKKKFVNKIVCGDCLELLKEIPDKSIDLVLTDPPYNIGFIPQRGTFDAIKNDNLNWEKFGKFIQPILNNFYRILKDNSVAYIFTGFSSSSSFYYQYLINAGFNVKCQLVWVKNNFGIGYHFRPQHEDIWVCFKGNPPPPKNAISSVIFESKVSSSKQFHSCQKPLSLIRRLIQQYTKEKEIILDSFVGSGSVAVASKQLNRKFIGIEIEEDFCKIAEKRLKETPTNLNKFTLMQEKTIIQIENETKLKKTLMEY